jgi:hypothetical protein
MRTVHNVQTKPGAAAQNQIDGNQIDGNLAISVAST